MEVWTYIDGNPMTPKLFEARYENAPEGEKTAGIRAFGNAKTEDVHTVRILTPLPLNGWRFERVNERWHAYKVD